MWSMWHCSRATSTPHRAHLLPSRSQTLRRVPAQISGGCRLTAIVTLPQVEVRNFEPAEADRTAVAEAHELTGVAQHGPHFVVADERVFPADRKPRLPARRCGHAIPHVARAGAWVTHAAHIQVHRIGLDGPEITRGHPP